MDFRDVMTLSPLGILKTFDFSTRKIVDTGLALDHNQRICWDPSNATRIFSAGSTIIKTVSITDGSTNSIDCAAYAADATNIIGLSADHDLLILGKESGCVSILDLNGLSLKCQIAAGKNLTVCKAYKSIVICGGKENQFSIWDANRTDSPIFTAKNVRPDTLDLKAPVWLADASFVEGYENSLFMTASKYGEFSIYDTRSDQRRPVSRSAWRMSRKHGKKSVGTGHNAAMLRDFTATRPITSAVAYTSGPGNGLRAVAGNAIGDICLLDFRVPHLSLITGDVEPPKGLKMARSTGGRAAVAPEAVKIFMPASGAISGLVCGGAGCANLPHVGVNSKINDQPIVLSSSIDRFFRVYHRDTGEMLAKVFAKTPISNFLVRDSAEYLLPTPVVSEYGFKQTNRSLEKEVDVEGLKESDSIWAKMQPVVVKTIRPASRRKDEEGLEENEVPKKKRPKVAV